MNLSISRYKLIHYIILSGTIIFLPLSAFSQGKDSLVINVAFQAAPLNDFDRVFKSHNNINSVSNNKDLSTSLNYYFKKNWFVGVTGEYKDFKTIYINNLVTQSKMYGYGVTAGKNLPISNQLSLQISLTLKILKGYLEYDEAFEYGRSYIQATFTSDIIHREASISPALFYTPFKRIGLFLQLEGLSIFNIEDSGDEAFTTQMNFKLSNSHIGLSYTIID